MRSVEVTGKILLESRIGLGIFQCATVVDMIVRRAGHSNFRGSKEAGHVLIWAKNRNALKVISTDHLWTCCVSLSSSSRTAIISAVLTPSHPGSFAVPFRRISVSLMVDRIFNLLIESSLGGGRSEPVAEYGC